MTFINHTEPIVLLTVTHRVFNPKYTTVDVNQDASMANSTKPLEISYDTFTQIDENVKSRPKNNKLVMLCLECNTKAKKRMD